MAKIEDCPGFETFGADVKEARKAKNLARKDLAEKVNIDTRYLGYIIISTTNVSQLTHIHSPWLRDD